MEEKIIEVLDYTKEEFNSEDWIMRNYKFKVNFENKEESCTVYRLDKKEKINAYEIINSLILNLTDTSDFKIKNGTYELKLKVDDKFKDLIDYHSYSNITFVDNKVDKTEIVWSR